MAIDSPPTNPNRTPNPNRGFVYFVLAPISNRIRIGSSPKPRKRLYLMNGASPEQLELLATMECDDMHEEEARLHFEFAKYRAYGEWFHAADPIIDFIEKFRGEDIERREIAPKLESAKKRLFPKRSMEFDDLLAAWKATGGFAILPRESIEVVSDWKRQKPRLCGDLWIRTEVDRRRRMLLRGDETSSRVWSDQLGTQHTGTLLSRALATDEGDALAVFALAFREAVFGRPGVTMPDGWAPEVQKFVIDSLDSSWDRVRDRDWFTDWEREWAGAFPGYTLKVGIPEDAATLAEVLQTQLARLAETRTLVDSVSIYGCRHCRVPARRPRVTTMLELTKECRKCKHLVHPDCLQRCDYE